MSMYGFETTAARIDYVDDVSGSARHQLTRIFAGALLAAIGIYGVLHTFDPVVLSVVQVFFMITTVLGVALAALSQD